MQFTSAAAVLSESDVMRLIKHLVTRMQPANTHSKPDSNLFVVSIVVVVFFVGVQSSAAATVVFVRPAPWRQRLRSPPRGRNQNGKRKNAWDSGRSAGRIERGFERKKPDLNFGLRDSSR